MRVLIVENMDGTPLGQIGLALREANVEIVSTAAYLGQPLPEGAGDFDGLIVLGGEQDALDDDHYPYMPGLCALMRDFVECDKSVLGVCLGSQLLARAFGGDNLLKHTREFGWQSVKLTDDGKRDAVLGSLGDQFSIFEWHVDSFTLPEGAVHLASNEAAKHQAFRIGRAAYGMQFHFEANQSVVAGWCENFPASVERMSPGWSQRFDDECALYGASADAAGLTIARNWLKTLPR
jgi:GMP synthase-like glutamine amidotransferase